MTRPAGSSSTAGSASSATRGLVAARLAVALWGLGALAAPGVVHAAPPPGTSVPGVEPGSVAPLVDRVKGAVVTIQSTKFIRRFAVEDPWSRMLREQLGAPGP